jgi:hypothetical protein
VSYVLCSFLTIPAPHQKPTSKWHADHEHHPIMPVSLLLLQG